MTNSEQQPDIAVPEHKLLRKIGEGSYGQVWLAQNEFGRFRAVKVVFRDKFEGETPFNREFDGVKRFERISRDHDGLVDILQIGKDAGRGFFYCVMEAADDQSGLREYAAEHYTPKTLSSELKLKRRLPVDDCVRMGRELCGALEFLHSQGLIHRDVKPSNIIFVGGHPKIADIGLVAETTSAKTFVGTAGFIPPEGPNSPQGDIYALGKVLYELSTGKDRSEFPALPEQSLFDERFLELNEVLLRACHSNPKERYPTAAAMASELDLLSRGESVRRLHHLEDVVKKLKHAGAAFLLAALVVGTIVFQVLQSRQRTREALQLRIGSRVAMSSSFSEKGDYLAALPPAVEALQIDDQMGGENNQTHRLRIGMLLSASPKIARRWTLSDGKIRYCDLRNGFALATVREKYWQVFDIATGSALTPQMGEEAEPENAVFVGEGDRVLATNGKDRTACLVNWQTGATELTLPHPDLLTFANASSDGGLLLTACGANPCAALFLWDARTGARLRAFEEHGDHIFFAGISPGNRFVVSASMDRTARVWDIATGKQIGLPLEHKSWVYSAAFSPDEKVLATAGYDRQVRLWKLPSNPEESFANLEEQPPPLLAHGDGVFAIQFTPGGEGLLSASLDRTARLWNPYSHQLIQANHTFSLPSPLMAACFDSTGKFVLTGGNDGDLTLWDTRAVLQPMQWAGSSRPAPAIASPNGKWKIQFLTPGMRLVSIDSGQEISIALPAPPTVSKFSPDSSKFLCAAGSNSFFLVHLGTGVKRELLHSSVITSAEFSPDSAKLVIASYTLALEKLAAQIWDAETFSKIGPPLKHDDGIRSAAFSPDGKLVATAGEDHTVRLWSSDSGEPIDIQPMRHRGKVFSVAFAANHPWLVTTGEDKAVILWDWKTGEPLSPPLQMQIDLEAAVFFEDDTSILATTSDGGQWKWPLWIDKRPIGDLKRITAELSGRELPQER